MALPIPRSGQEKLSRQIQRSLDNGQLVCLYITRFRPLNHCLVLHSYQKTPRGIDYFVYDPNLPGKICLLQYDNATRSFYYQKTWYYPGGLVNSLRVYHRRWL